MTHHSDFMLRNLREYPSLFLNDGEFLNHAFFVIGNGFRWRDGGMRDGLEGSEGVWADCAVLELRAAEMARCVREVCIDGGCDLYFLASDLTLGYVVYPICEYSKIMAVPSDVRPDWLAAANRAVAWARSPYARITESDAAWLERAEARLGALKP